MGLLVLYAVKTSAGVDEDGLRHFEVRLVRPLLGVVIGRHDGEGGGDN